MGGDPVQTKENWVTARRAACTNPSAASATAVIGFNTTRSVHRLCERNAASSMKLYDNIKGTALLWPRQWRF